MQTSATPTSQRILELLQFAEAERRHAETLARATGEHFNIFKILGIGHYEVRTHSPILGDLLNPKGSHGQGDTFLRLFINQLDVKDFDPASARLELEYHIGTVTDKSGGRIDIVILDGNGHAIFIENKIYAGDQEKQLQRYRERDAQAHLLYLTLQGDLPAGFTEERLQNIRAIRISYAIHIRDWLVACRKEAASLPQVRETISQYLHLIRELTGQSLTQFMNKELINKITDDEDSLSAYFALASELENVKVALMAKLDVQLDDAAKATFLHRDGRIEDLHVKYSSIYFTTESLTKHNLRIGFIFDRGGFQDLDFGFMKIDKDKPCDIGEKLLTTFREQFPTFSPTTPTDWWPAWADFEPPYGYWNSEAFQAIASGELAANMKNKLIIMSNIAKLVCPDEVPTSKNS
ncbi:MAG: hypothetical protein JWR19_4178 [Pedosphaera sp.]|nr:hypothetical protein [Pedosphaera sp.]